MKYLSRKILAVLRNCLFARHIQVYRPPRPKHRVAGWKRKRILARASVQLASAPLTANSRISRGRINPPFAKYARTIRSAMRDPEISPWQSSCFRRPLARDGSAGGLERGCSGGGSSGGGGGGDAEGRRTRERAGGVASNAYLSRAETQPPARALSLARLLACSRFTWRARTSARVSLKRAVR